MTPVLVGLLIVIGLALAVVGVVAYPHLRAGAPLLSPEGERLAREVSQRAQDRLTGSATERRPGGVHRPASHRPKGATPGFPTVAPLVSGMPTAGAPPVDSVPQAQAQSERQAQPERQARFEPRFEPQPQPRFVPQPPPRFEPQPPPRFEPQPPPQPAPQPPAQPAPGTTPQR